jgi:multiple sugar transport system substrate-binding protein
MAKIEFSVMEPQPGHASKLLPLLDAFEQQTNIHVNLLGIPWSKGWSEIAKFGIYRDGPDVSCIGTTWIASLASMQVLRPFSEQQVHALGGKEAFFDSGWRAGLTANDSTPWAIPWLGDAIAIYYWKDALEEAGIQDLEAAFASDEAMVLTLEKLQNHGYTHPLAITTANISVILHEAAHWIWSAGGDFISADHRTAIFNQPAALEGLKKYFGLRPFISPESLAASHVQELFDSGKAVVYLGGPSMANSDRHERPAWGEHLGIARVPGTTYVGGSNFVIWQYSPQAQNAFELVRFLLSQPINFPGSPHDTLVPARREALNTPSASDAFNQTFLQALQTGRGFPNIRVWGSIEGKLIVAMSDIWADLFANPEQGLDDCLHKYLDPLAQHLNIVLKN